jgi:excinuclease UvrABC nuclease subunit
MNSENPKSFGFIYRTIKLKKDKKNFVKLFLDQLKSVMDNNEESYNNESNEIKKHQPYFNTKEKDKITALQ